MGRPQVKGRVEVVGDSGGFLLRFNLEVHGAVFGTPMGLVDARDSPATLEYVARVQPGYLPPPSAPLPRVSGNPYMLVEYSIVYVHPARVEIIQGGADVDSTTMISSEKYTIVDGLAYPHLVVVQAGRDFVLDSDVKPLAAYPITTGIGELDAYIKWEYILLREGVEAPYLRAASLVCKPGACLLEELWRKNIGVERLRLIPRDWAELLGVQLDPLPLSIRIEDGVARLEGTGVARIEARCGEENIAFEGVVNGVREWRIGEECIATRYSSLCPSCLLPL